MRKIQFFAPDVWKKAFICQKKPIFLDTQKHVFNRASTIPNILTHSTILVYAGNQWQRITPSKWSAGFKFGEFTWNRRPALYKAKQLRKKKNKANKANRTITVPKVNKITKQSKS